MNIYLKICESILAFIAVITFIIGFGSLDSDFYMTSVQIAAVSMVAFGGAIICHNLKR